MTEPTTSTGAAMTALGWLAAGGISQAITNAIGIDSTVIWWAVVGGYCGPIFADSVGWRVGITTFIAASMFSALIATGLQNYWSITTKPYVWTIAALIAFAFAPLRQRAITHIPALFDSFIARIFKPSGGKSDEGKS